MIPEIPFVKSDAFAVLACRYSRAFRKLWCWVNGALIEFHDAACSLRNSARRVARSSERVVACRQCS
jgi:hypothetical protein